MKGTLVAQAKVGEFAAATPAIQRILRTWSQVDWLCPPLIGQSKAVPLAQERLREHRRLGALHQPRLFPEPHTITWVEGDLDAFTTLCTQVRENTGYDWKFGILKILTREHSKEQGWALENQTCSTLFLHHAGHVFWGHQLVEFPQDAWSSASLGSSARAEAAGFYHSYANGDLMECLEWQLAESSPTLDGNPFWPLLTLYNLGFYPFSLSLSQTLLFSFQP